MISLKLVLKYLTVTVKKKKVYILVSTERGGGGQKTNKQHKKAIDKRLGNVNKG